VSSAEIDVMARCQDLLARGPAPAAARAYSAWGEHAAGWVALGCLGALIDRRRRDAWVATAAGAFAAHAVAVVLKRVVRRHRPSDPSVRVLVRTPSDLSFPSAHAASTTAAAVALAPMVGSPAAAAGALAMGAARVLLGVHYPSDVAAGAAIGLLVGRASRRLVRERMTR
jgi:membrane-associated phospholipid phosphatase